jgi:DNA modification methylase
MIEIIKSELIAVSKLETNKGQISGVPKNPRYIKDARFEKLKKSIEDNPEFLGARELIVYPLNEKFIILGGNMRYTACKELGYKELPCKVLPADYSAEQLRAITIKDNVAFGENDWENLANEWDAQELEEWGMELPELTEELELEAEEDDYEIPNEINTDIVLGDLFEIGEHKLLCGDSTDSDQVAKLMNGEKADIAFTSPPYNAGTTPTEVKMGKTSKYANDDDNKTDDDYLKLLTDFTNNTLLFSDYSFVNIQSLSGNKIALIDYLYNLKSIYADTIIWNKQNAQPAMANNVLNSQFEYVHIFSHKANRAIGTKEFRGTISNVLDIQKQTKNKVKEHNATFPIEFVSFFITNFCNNSVLDLFLGSGSTMVASHQLKRKCYGMELDPKYCQVIIDRMKKLDPSLVIKRNGEVIS